MMFCSIQCPTCHRVVYLITGIPSVMRTAFVNTFRFNVRLLSIILSLHNSCRFISIGMLPVPQCGEERFRRSINAVQHVEAGACSKCRGQDNARRQVFKFISNNEPTRQGRDSAGVPRRE